MSKLEKLSRRKLLLIVALAGGALAVPKALQLAHRLAQSPLEELTNSLAAFDTDALGKEYCQLNPSENSANALSTLIENDLNKISSKGFAEGISELVHNDFLQANTVRLHGWIVSRTEARLLALAALST